MRNRFPALMAISGILRVVGWVVAGISVIVAIAALPPLLQFFGSEGQGGGYPGSYGSGSPWAIFPLLGGLVGVAIGLGTAGFGELLRVLVAIEENTRQGNARSDAQPMDAIIPGGIPADQYVGRRVVVHDANGKSYAGTLRNTQDSRIFEIVDDAGHATAIWSFRIVSIEPAPERAPA